MDLTLTVSSLKGSRWPILYSFFIAYQFCLYLSSLHQQNPKRKAKSGFHLTLGVVAHACNPSTQEFEAENPANQGYITKPCLKNSK